MGIPIIQLPEDLLMAQEVIYKVRPEVIIETGTAHGGTAVFYASMLELLDDGRVISIDNEIRKYNRLAIQAHPMSKRITLIEGDSAANETVDKVRRLLRANEKVLVTLDSNHTYAHVSKELEKYSPMVSPESYLIVFDGVMKFVADAPHGKSKWKRDNPGRAVEEFLSNHPEFEPDYYYNRMAVTYCPGGFLRRKSSR